MIKFICLLTLISFTCQAGIEDHYTKLTNKKAISGPANIDYIYLLNLDQRPERLAKSLKDLAEWGIYPQRFPGVYGWTIPPEVLNDIGLKFQHGMWTGRETVMHFPPNGDGTPQFVFLNGSSYGKAYFSGWTVKGTIGCSLSHLSMIKDGYDSGYNTIWILEDDFSIIDDPYKLSGLIEELDALTGPDGWDVLYTDYDFLHVDKNKSLEEQIPLMWRPDMPGRNIQFLAEHQDLGDKFLKIGSRMRAHSIIYRRCGMKKILDFYKEHNNFLPYDQELALIPEIKVYVVKDSIVSVHEVTSDTRYRSFQ